MKQGNPGRRSRKAMLEAVHAASAAPAPADPDVPPPPALLNDRAREIWTSLAADLVARCWLHASDHRALMRLCQYYCEWEMLTDALSDRRCKGGLRLTEQHKREYYGTVTKVRGEVAARRALEAEIRALELHFGLTPSSRAALVSRIVEARDPKQPPLAARRSASAAASPSSSIPPAPASPLGLLATRHARVN